MRKHICTREKAITIILSFVMIIGLLGGMKLDVRAEEQVIDKVEIKIDPPVGGKLLSTAYTVYTSGVKVTKFEWQCGLKTATGTATYQTAYQLYLYLEPEANYKFKSGMQVTINGKDMSLHYDFLNAPYVWDVFNTEPKPSDEGVEITEGNNSVYKPGSNESLFFCGNDQSNALKVVKVDGKDVVGNAYDKSGDSLTYIIFKSEYLETLGNGKHNIEMIWEINGIEKSATASFYVGEVVPGNADAKQSESNSESKPKHTCNFEWVITLDPTTGADGLEEYKCMGCGVVKESHPIPASVAVIKDFYGKVKEAPEKGSITYDAGKLYTISDYVLKKMAERNDEAVTVKFEYQNKKYQIIFPAGLDYSAVLNDEETMYGYFGAAAKLGLKVVEL